MKALSKFGYTVEKVLVFSLTFICIHWQSQYRGRGVQHEYRKPP
jgi:hypothetical protein